MDLSSTVAWSTCNHVPIEIHNFKSRERDREIVFPKQKPDLDPFIPMHCRPRSGGNRPLLGNRGEKKSGTQIHQQVNIVIVDVKDLSFTWACNKKQIGQKKIVLNSAPQKSRRLCQPGQPADEKNSFHKLASVARKKCKYFTIK